MKYAIVYLIKGRAEKYQRGVTRELSKNFGIRNLNDHVSPHVTLKAPFVVRNIKDIEKSISNSCKELKAEKISIRGFGNFDKKVLYLDVPFSKEARGGYNLFIKNLVAETNLKLGPFDGANFHPHATITYVKNEKMFNKLAKFLSGKNPNYDLRFDNITILKKTPKKWRVHKKFKIR